MKKGYAVLILIVATMLTFAACHSGGSSEPPATTTNPETNPTNPNPTTNPTPTTNPAPTIPVFTGIFVDGPVEGLTFSSGSQAGTTDAAGAFKYESGADVTFKLGNVTLGHAPGKSLITPLDLVQAIDSAATISDPRVIQITQFLMTVNASPDPNTMLMPPNAITNAALPAVPVVDLSAGPVDLASFIGVITTHILVTPADAAAHLQASLTTLVPKPGVFAALDSAANPKLGLKFAVTPNLTGSAFDVAGVAAALDGSTWSVAGTLSTNGSLQATGAGTGTPAAPTMTITGTMTSATQLTVSVGGTFNGGAQQVPMTLEKAVAPAAASKLALAADPGVTVLVPPTQIQHIAADLSILADGQINGHFVQGEMTGLPAAISQGGRYATLSGIVTSAGNVIAMGGMPGTSESFLSRSATPAPAAIFLTGTVNVDGSVSATAKSTGLTTPALTIPPLSFVTTTNAFVGLYVGTHSDPKAPATFPSTVAFAVNNDGSVHGWARFFKGLVKQPESDDLLDGTVDAGGVLLPTPAVIALNNAPLAPIAGNPGVPGLVMTNDDGGTVPGIAGVLVGPFPSSFGGTITAGAVNGNYAFLAAALATGTFSATLLP